ncbi:uncharacterized protein LOC119104867 [Pollicipes pollicipes]|uniref:uncharacterized protein LOC119104867 n=1 Tax=Pollicipes pollicipes TaxID=41117 RepID=UPI0018858B4F|nr:uncharacterized protein LOC119104867 [Pollicipes pollicipes]
MTRSCSAFGCSKRQGDRPRYGDCLSFHKYPHHDPRLLRKWIAATRRQGEKRRTWEPSQSALLCSDHFMEADFEPYRERRMLREGSIPSRFMFPEQTKAVARISSVRCVKKELKKGVLPSVFRWKSPRSEEVARSGHKKMCRVRKQRLHAAFRQGKVNGQESTLSSSETRHQYLTGCDFRTPTSPPLREPSTGDSLTAAPRSSTPCWLCDEPCARLRADAELEHSGLTLADRLIAMGHAILPRARVCAACAKLVRDWDDLMTRALRVRVLIEFIIGRKTAAATCRQFEETNDARATTISDNATNLTYSSAEDDTISETIAYSETGFAGAVDPEPPAVAEEDADETWRRSGRRAERHAGPVGRRGAASLEPAARARTALWVEQQPPPVLAKRRQGCPEPAGRTSLVQTEARPKAEQARAVGKEARTAESGGRDQPRRVYARAVEFITKDEEAKGFGKTRGTVRDASAPYNQNLSGSIAFCGASGYHPRVG